MMSRPRSVKHARDGECCKARADSLWQARTLPGAACRSITGQLLFDAEHRCGTDRYFCEIHSKIIPLLLVAVQVCLGAAAGSAPPPLARASRPAPCRANGRRARRQAPAQEPPHAGDRAGRGRCAEDKGRRRALCCGGQRSGGRARCAARRGGGCAGRSSVASAERQARAALPSHAAAPQPSSTRRGGVG